MSSETVKKAKREAELGLGRDLVHEVKSKYAIALSLAAIAEQMERRNDIEESRYQNENRAHRKIGG